MKQVLKYLSTLLPAAWKWLDGKKTIIGLSFFLAGQGIDYFETTFLIAIWHCAPITVLPQIIASCNWLATVMGGTGLMHKGVKGAAAEEIAALKEAVNKA